MPERLQKILARAGLGSRRACEEMIVDGRVSVNGRIADVLPVLVDADRDDIRVDGRPIKTEPKAYYLLNKPRGVVCTNRDPSGRRRAVDLLGSVGARLFCIGRLDADSEGLLLLTNDGALTQQLTHPRYEVPKTYRAQVRGRIGNDDLEQIRKGVWMAEGKTRTATVKLTYRGPQRSVLEITLREGRNRQVRRVLARLGYPVRRLRRIAIGELTAKGLAAGKHRRLRPSEVRYLRLLAGQPPRRRKRKSR